MTEPPPQVTPVWTPPPSQYGYYPYGGYQPRPPTNGMALASMIVAIVGLAGICAWGPLSAIISPVGAILGHVARRRIKQTGEQGDGMALAGIIMGWIGFAIAILVTAAYVAFFVWAVNLPTSQDFTTDSMLEI